MLEVSRAQTLVVFEFQALGSIRRNGRDLRREDGGVLRIDAVAFAHLQQAWVDRLQAGLVVNLLGTLAFEDDCGNARNTIPHSEVRDRGTSGERETVGAFLNPIGVVEKYLQDGDVRVAVVDGDVDGHLFEREDGSVGRLLVARDQDAGLSAGLSPHADQRPQSTNL